MSKLKKMIVETNIMDEAEALRIDNMVRESIRSDSLEEGMEKGKIETTINMIKNIFINKIDINTISKVTGKSISEIDKIAKEI